jgi:SAM-dependent methyltransferase
MEGMMANYGEIYDKVFAEHGGYRSPMWSPGFRLCLQAQQRLRLLGNRHLDYGCGAGFVVEIMRSGHFQKESFGVDVSQNMVDAANSRIGSPVVKWMQGAPAPFDDHSFDIVTCFDVLEHLDAHDVATVYHDIMRLLRPGGALFCNISLRLSGSVDMHGKNLHRTVESAEWWDRIFNFDEYTVSKTDMELTGWKHLH